MKKIKLILGKSGSGKSSIAKAMTCMVKEVVYVNPHALKSTWVYSQCNEDTKVIVFDEVGSVEDVINLVLSTCSEVRVDKQCHYPFTINPNIIIVCRENISREDLLNHGSSISRRIEIIETL